MRCRLKRSLQLLAACACAFVYVNFFLSLKPETSHAGFAESWSQQVQNSAQEKGSWGDAVRMQREGEATFVVDEDVIYPDEEHYTDDRILSQLRLVPQHRVKRGGNSSSTTQKILIYNGLGGFAVKPGKSTFKEQKCAVQDCEIMGDRKQLPNADVVLFQTAPGKHIERPPGQVWALFMLESPYHTMGLSSLNGKFNWTATYRHDSTLVAPYEKFVPYNSSVLTKPQSKNFAAGKQKKVAWFVSNCGARNKRRQYAEELAQFIEVDIYGNCGKLKCPRHKANQCFDMLDKDYKFYLSFENSNCRDYITEKFFVNGLQHDVIPIVMGAAPEDYARSAPPHSFIHVDDFESPKELADYLHILDKNDDLYNEYFRWKGTGELINTYFWCRMCALAHNTAYRGQSWYDNVDQWWRGQDICIGQKNWREVPRANKLIAPLANLIEPPREGRERGHSL